MTHLIEMINQVVSLQMAYNANKNRLYDVHLTLKNDGAELEFWTRTGFDVVVSVEPDYNQFSGFVEMEKILTNALMDEGTILELAPTRMVEVPTKYRRSQLNYAKDSQ